MSTWFKFASVIVVLVGVAPLMAAEQAPAFTLPTNSGEVSLASLKGKVVYLDFWASWCTPCRKSFPWMDELQKRHKDEGLVVLAVNLDKKTEYIDKFLGSMKPSFTIAFDPEGKVADKYELRGMPTSYIIDRKGQLRERHLGFREKDKQALEDEIQKLLDEGRVSL